MGEQLELIATAPVTVISSLGWGAAPRPHTLDDLVAELETRALDPLEGAVFSDFSWPITSDYWPPGAELSADLAACTQAYHILFHRHAWAGCLCTNDPDLIARLDAGIARNLASQMFVDAVTEAVAKFEEAKEQVEALRRSENVRTVGTVPEQMARIEEKLAKAYAARAVVAQMREARS